MSALSEFILENSISGFLAEEEGEALYRWARSVSDTGPCLEIGSYCGKSAVYIGTACREKGNTLYAVDHHRGSEEHQLGEAYHDDELFDKANNCMDSFPAFRETLRKADLEGAVVPIVASSALVVRDWNMALGMVFIDGGHSHEAAMFDCVNWATKVATHGILAIHDIYPSIDFGGQGPRLAMEAVLATGVFEQVEQVCSLAILRKK